MTGSFLSSTGMGFMTVVPIFIFGAALFIISFAIIYAVKQKKKNDASPRLTVAAFVSSKRTKVSTSQHPVAGDASGANGFHTTSDTSYFVTFEVESGDRMEFRVSGSEYGMLSEGDVGRLSFQGTRYLGFERERGNL